MLSLRRHQASVKHVSLAPSRPALPAAATLLTGAKPPTQSSAPAKTSANQPALTIIRVPCPSKAWFEVPSFCLYGAIPFAGDFSQLLI